MVVVCSVCAPKQLNSISAIQQWSVLLRCYVDGIFIFLLFFGLLPKTKSNGASVWWFAVVHISLLHTLHWHASNGSKITASIQQWHAVALSTTYNVPLLCAQNQPIIIINVWHGSCPLLRDKQGQLVNNFDRKTQQMNSIVEYFVSVKQQQ